MKKIPTMFDRDWDGDKSRVIDKINPGCEWVAAGEGIATKKIDGTSCMIRNGSLFKRRELKDGDVIPVGFELSDTDVETGKTIGWVPVSKDPTDKWHRDAFISNSNLPDGTYELVGPKIQGNRERFEKHILVSHGETGTFEDVPRSFMGLMEWFSGRDIEGIVFHHPDGRMAKIKLRDFGIKRPPAAGGGE